MRQMVLTAAMAAMIVGAVAAGRANPIGSFSLEQATPAAGDNISFFVDVTGLPTNGGATIAPWVELSCGNVYEDVQPSISPVIPNTDNPTRAYFTLSSAAWVTAGLTAQDCEAYLFWDGFNGPKRRKTNTLAALFFSVSAAP